MRHKSLDLLSQLLRSLFCACLLGLLSLVPCSTLAQVPTDNPIASAYPMEYNSGEYGWTDNIHWTNVYNILDYGGVADGITDNLAAFQAARDEAAAAGGGVVYFPAGTYYLSDSLYLMNGIVLRGDPTGVINDARQSDYAPPSRLVFPAYVPSFQGSGTSNTTAFKKIYYTTTNPYSNSTDDSNIGVVNLDINRAAVNLFGEAADNTSHNQDFLVFGVRINNASTPDSSVPQAWQNQWQRWPDRFAAMVKVFAYANILVANNRLDDNPTDDFEQIGYLIRESSGNPTQVTLSNPGQAAFRYEDTNMIVANWVNHAWYATNNPADGPLYAPGMFREGIVIRENWMYVTKGEGIQASGKGLRLYGNVRRDTPNKTLWIYPTGLYKATPTNFNRDRGWDVGGRDVVVEKNDVQTDNWIVGWNSGYRNNDGECTWDNQSTVVNGFTCRNNTVTGSNATIQIYRTGDINNVTILYNTITGASNANAIWVWADIGNGHYRVDNAHVDGNIINNHMNIFLSGTAGGSRNEIFKNIGSGGNITYAVIDNPAFSANTNFTLDPH